MFEFGIANLEHNVADGGVTNVHWTASKTTDGTTASSYGSTSLTYDPTSSEFVPFEAVTKEKVIEWLTAAMGEEQIAALDASLDAQITQIVAPTTLFGLPPSWTTLPADGEGEGEGTPVP